MTEHSVDVVAALDDPHVEVKEIVRAREFAGRDADARRKVQNLVASLPSDVEAARHDHPLALRKGLALWVAGRDAEAALWLEHSSATVAKIVRGRCLGACGRP